MVPLSRVGLVLMCGFLLGAFQSDQRFNRLYPPQLWYRYGDTTGSTGAFFGRSLTGVGDQNNDGFDDVLIASNLEKKVFLYLGGVQMDSVPAKVFHRNEAGFGFIVANLGDVNGNGQTDFAIRSGIGVYAYWGGTLDTTPALLLPAFFPNVTSAGDVNGDGFDDVLVSEVSWNDYQGKAWLYFGGNPMDTIPDWSVEGDSARYWFGFSISGNGDLNNDGYTDIAIAGFRALQSRTPEYAKVHLGGESLDTVPDLTIDRSELPGLLGRSVWITNDLNGDMYDELMMGSGADTGLYVFYGSDSIDGTPDLVLRGSGFSTPAVVASLGDVNGDGYSDLVTGNPAAWNRLGEVLLYLGHPSMNGEFDVGWTGFLGPWVGAGQAVGWCGDVNGDTLNDIVFSSYDPNWPTRNGRVDIFGGDTSLVVSVDEQGPYNGVPEAFELKQNYPNPFNPSTTIEYALSTQQLVSLTIYDVRGSRVRSLLSAMVLEPGSYRVKWDGRDDQGTSVASGMYFYQIQAGNNSVLIKKMVLIR